jgi:hypothetical protein
MEEEFIIFNPTLGICDLVSIGKTDHTDAWLEEPYDMVGPFDVNELKTKGKISFAACFVMSKKRWQDERISLGQKAYSRQRKVYDAHHKSDKEYREILYLPLDGELSISQIKTAYRKLIKKAHPDVGGSHEHFIKITQARDALLKY